MKDNDFNEVIEASYKLNLNEQRLILACIKQINCSKVLSATDFFELTINDFSSLFYTSKKASYQALVNVSKCLFRRYIIINNPYPNDSQAKYLKTYWISSISYDPNEGKIGLRFAKEILPYLNKIKKNFTRYKLDYIGKMTSIYAIRLYQLLVQWQGEGTREVTLDWLKNQFNISDQYNQMCNFKKRVLEPAINDINEHSNFNISWQQRKTGRRVTHLIITFSEKK